MRQERFESEHGELWKQLEDWLKGKPTLPSEEIPVAYRRLCHHLALARERRYSASLNDRLQPLALALHQRLYGEGEGGLGFWKYVTRDFPREVRIEWRLVIVSSILLFGSWTAAFLVVRRNPDLVHLVLSPSQAAQYARMYDPAAKKVFEMTGPMRDVAMFGVYIWNNIGIDFQVFASGLVLGIGPIFSLLFNGVHGGAVMAHLTNLGFVSTFYGFVSGHSSFELMGAALSGAAGLRLGLGLMHPGRRSRLESLKDAGRRGARLLMGAALMTFIAAGLEGFWSANKVVPWKVKVAVGICFWTMLIAYFLLAGRRERKHA
jgi:uncharacterized membrane protein SpoIIM required for sporulation